MSEGRPGRRRATVAATLLLVAAAVTAVAFFVWPDGPGVDLAEGPDAGAPTEPAEQDGAEADTSPSPEPAPSPPDADADGDGGQRSGVGAIGDFDTDTVSSSGFPSGGGETVYLTDVRVGSHDGFDRVVLEFEGGEPPAYRIGYTDPPITEDGSGETVAVDGEAFLEIRLTPASGVELAGEGLRTTYEGPTRLGGGRAVTEVVRTGDFEATLAWVAGVDRTAGFAVDVLADPLRFVVDVAHR